MSHTDDDFDIKIGNEYPVEVEIGRHVAVAFEDGRVILSGHNEAYYALGAAILVGDRHIPAPALILAAADRQGIAVLCQAEDYEMVEALVAQGVAYLAPGGEG
jgi:hypothetical protein